MKKSFLLIALCAAAPASADFPPSIDVVTDTAELSNGPHVTIDNEWVRSRAIGDLDGDGLGDRIIEIPATDGDRCPGVAILASTLNAGFDFSREELNNLVRINDQEIVESDGDIACEFQNIRGFTEPLRIGDLNGDGLIDLLINVSGTFDNVPRVVFGSTAAGIQINLNELDGSNGFAVTRISTSIFPVGDINGDGFDDIGLQLPSSQGVIAGRASFGSVVDESIDQRLIEASQISSLRGLGDIDGDGFDDLVAFSRFPLTATGHRIPRIIYGATDLALSSLEDEGARVDTLMEECGIRRCTLYPIGDIDGDGLDDILASEDTELVNLPPRAIIYGRAGGLVIRDSITAYQDGERTLLVGEGVRPIVDTGSLYDGSFFRPFFLATGQRIDLDGDNVDDLVFRQNNNGSRPGWYTLFGIPGERPPVRSISELDGILGAAFDYSTLPLSVSSGSRPEIGDLDLDGIDDFMFNAFEESPYVSGRSREIDGIDEYGLGVRRSPNELTLFWQDVQGAETYRVEFDNRFIDEVDSNTTSLVIRDDTGNTDVQIRINAIDSAGSVLSTQLRRVPAYEPFIEDFSIDVQGIDQLELFIEFLPSEFARAIGRGVLILRDGVVINRTASPIIADLTVQPGRSYSYQLVVDTFANRDINDVALESGPRLQLASAVIEIMTPADPNQNVSDNRPAAPENLGILRYAPGDAVLFWKKAEETDLQYEVYRDDVLLFTGIAMNYFDNDLADGAGAHYEVIALRADGSRSAVSSVTLESVGTAF